MESVNKFLIMNLGNISKALVGSAFIFVCLLNSCSSREDPSQFYHPAEFEPVKSTYFIWSAEYYGILQKLIRIISEKDKVTIFVNKKVEDTTAIRTILENHGCVLRNVQFIEMNTNLDNIWIRDYGPVYLVNRLGEKKLVQFNYFWTIPDFHADFASISGLPVIKSVFNSTGGSREVNGKGTMILCEDHELYVNDPKTRQDIEIEMIDKLRQKKIIWLKKGIPQDDSMLEGPLYDQIYPKGVKGHVDEFCRFADANTVLISSVTEKEANEHPVFDEAKKRLDENYKILMSSTDQDGNKFNVVKVPMAPVLIADRRAGPEGKMLTLVTSYMNFITTNSIIVLPSYVSENSNNKELQNKEKEVENIFKEVFPSREIIKVLADTLNFYSGGFHCISINEPLVKN